MTSIVLPIAPSVNSLYRNVPGRGRAKTGLYINWLAEAGWVLKSQRPAPVVGHYELHIVVPGFRGDLDNRIKATSDLLVEHGIVEDDHLCMRLTIERTRNRETMLVTVVPATEEYGFRSERAAQDALKGASENE